MKYLCISCKNRSLSQIIINNDSCVFARPSNDFIAIKPTLCIVHKNTLGEYEMLNYVNSNGEVDIIFPCLVEDNRTFLQKALHRKIKDPFYLIENAAQNFFISKFGRIYNRDGKEVENVIVHRLKDAALTLDKKAIHIFCVVKINDKTHIRFKAINSTETINSDTAFNLASEALHGNRGVSSVSKYLLDLLLREKFLDGQNTRNI